MSYTLLPKLQTCLSLNTQGTDYFVSDIQGEYEVFITLLDQVNFDRTKDRVIATGDLIDRGSESLKCLGLLKEPWFHSVIGNHEMDILVYLMEPNHINQIIKNGGSWFQDAINSNSDFEIAQTIRLMMSVSITVSTEFGNIGVIHASAPANWQDINSEQVDYFSLIKECIYSHDVTPNELTDEGCLPDINNIDIVVHGHTTVPKPRFIGNRAWIDTIAVTGRPTLITAEELKIKTRERNL